jgi:hypothetical protein
MLKFLAAACGKRLTSEKEALWRELPTKLSTRGGEPSRLPIESPKEVAEGLCTRVLLC